MSILGFLFKPKKEMAKKNTKHVRVGKYEVSSHAQNRTVDASRNLKKKDMIINLLGKTSQNSKIYKHNDGTKQYDRVNEKNRTLTHIVNKTHVVKSINKFHDTPRARKQVYKNFK
ncbi:MAG: hypothetical protein E7368_01465 [Clostridiales bacterium]|nr:hypothetical protein [Clostridiales bacterium]